MKINMGQPSQSSTMEAFKFFFLLFSIYQLSDMERCNESKKEMESFLRSQKTKRKKKITKKKNLEQMARDSLSSWMNENQFERRSASSSVLFEI